MRIVPSQGSDRIRQDMFYPHAVPRVWAALTHKDSLARWLLPNDFEPRSGHTFTFWGVPEAGWNGIITCEVVEIVPLQRLAFTWSAHPRFPTMLITFTLEGIDEGTHLWLEQREYSRNGRPLSTKKRQEQQELPSLHLLLEEKPLQASRFFRIQVDEDALTDALLEFVCDPSATRNHRPVINELHNFAPEMVSVLEHMLLDGVSERADIAEYIHFVFGYLSA